MCDPADCEGSERQSLTLLRTSHVLHNAEVKPGEGGFGSSPSVQRCVVPLERSARRLRGLTGVTVVAAVLLVIMSRFASGSARNALHFLAFVAVLAAAGFAMALFSALRRERVEPSRRRHPTV